MLCCGDVLWYRIIGVENEALGSQLGNIKSKIIIRAQIFIVSQSWNLDFW